MKTIHKKPTLITANESYDGISVEESMAQATASNQPITNEMAAPTIYTDRKDGVRPEYDIRTDKWLLAQRAMQQVAEKKLQTRSDRLKAREEAAAAAAKTE